MKPSMKLMCLIAAVVVVCGADHLDTASSQSQAGQRLAERSQALDFTCGSGRYLYAAFDDGSVHVYDIDNGHQEVASSPPVPGVVDVSGACASAQTGMFYFSHEVYPFNGGVVAVDMYTLEVVWNQVYYPDTDRLSCSPDGSMLYVGVGSNSNILERGIAAQGHQVAPHVGRQQHRARLAALAAFDADDAVAQADGRER